MAGFKQSTCVEGFLIVEHYHLVSCRKGAGIGGQACKLQFTVGGLGCILASTRKPRLEILGGLRHVSTRGNNSRAMFGAINVVWPAWLDWTRR